MNSPALADYQPTNEIVLGGSAALEPPVQYFSILNAAPQRGLLGFL